MKSSRHWLRSSGSFGWKEVLALAAWVALFVVYLPSGFNLPVLYLGWHGLRLRILTAMLTSFLLSGPEAALLYLIVRA
jgi:hypothetical protein